MESAVENSSPVGAADYPKGFSSGVLSALEAVRVPAYIVDLQRRVRWQNAASIELVGDLRGRLDASVLCADDLARARDAFSRKLKGASHADVEVSVARRDGKQVRVAISTAPVKDADGVMIGSFGLVHVLEEVDPSLASPPRLSGRERETLTLLAAGYSTALMAEKMGISRETVRNHVKSLLRSLGASSRVEAVAKGRDVGLI